MEENSVTFIQSAPLGVCIVERDRQHNRVMYANDKLLSMLLIPQGENKIIGQPLGNILGSPEGKAFAKKLKGINPPKETVIHYDAYDDTERWAHITVSETIYDGKDAYALWGTDVTATVESEMKLKNAVKKADATADMKSNFLATMSHEIRTPMQSVFGLLELVSEENPPKNIQEMVNVAKNSASGLLEILDDILDFAKMDADKMDLDVFEVPVRTLVRGVLEALSVKVHGKNVELIDNIEEDVPFVVIGDPKRLRQILINLTGNALKFTESGDVTVRVTTKTKHVPQPEKGVSLRVEISDTGIGMSEEVCNKLFGAFAQADSSTSRKFGGTGLGLSISKKLVELMGGEIGVFSKEGKGSTFWFEIPTREVSTDASELEMPDLEGISILSVEDHPAGAREIVNSLRSMGANVESVPTYKEGLDLIKRRPFDVGVIDQGLPDGTGLELIRETTKIRPFMGLVMYTVHGDSALQHTLNSLGVKFLEKPASRLGLGETVKEASMQNAKMTIDGPTRLLIAEDTASVRDVLSRQLKAVGVEADFVDNGVAALEAIDTGKYGILFTDLHMPEMDGYELVKTIRDREKGDNNKHFPVISLTADVQMAQRQTYLSYGFDECLLKPVSLGQFRRLLIRWGLLVDQVDDCEAKEATDGLDVPIPDDGLPPAVDKNAMIEQMGAFDDTTIEMLGMFVDMTAPIVEQLRADSDAENTHGLAETAHSLKGGARSACCPVLGDIASDIQDSAEKGENRKELVDSAFKEFERVKDTIANLKS